MIANVYVSTIIINVYILKLSSSASITEKQKQFFIIVPQKNEINTNDELALHDKTNRVLRFGKANIQPPTPPPSIFHTNRMIEIMNFMKDHVQSTRYLYEEMKRISSTHLIKDELREMVAFLERSRNASIKRKVLKFYNDLRLSMHKGNTKDPWRFKKNDMVINYVRDPVNDGVLSR